MTTFPKRKDLFTAWSKAMVEGATVDKPSYPGTKKTTMTKQRRRRRRSRRRKRNAKKD